MKDQYAGDFGDYVKLAMLRRLSAGRELAVCWYRTPDDPSRNDGRHTAYLKLAEESKWRHLDPKLYDHLRTTVDGQYRTINEIQRILDVPGASFFDALLESKSSRAVWFAQFARWLGIGRDLLFLDPDNGIASPGFSGGTASITFDEIDYLQTTARTLIIYHHHTRAKGGHVEELKRVATRLTSSHSFRAVCALRASSWSPRSFFIVSPDQEIWDRAEQFASDWSPYLSFHAFTARPDDLGLTPGASAYHRVDALDANGGLDLAAEELLRSLE